MKEIHPEERLYLRNWVYSYVRYGPALTPEVRRQLVLKLAERFRKLDEAEAKAEQSPEHSA